MDEQRGFAQGFIHAPDQSTAPLLMRVSSMSVQGRGYEAQRQNSHAHRLKCNPFDGMEVTTRLHARHCEVFLRPYSVQNHVGPSERSSVRSWHGPSGRPAAEYPVVSACRVAVAGWCVVDKLSNSAVTCSVSDRFSGEIGGQSSAEMSDLNDLDAVHAIGT